MFAFTHAVLNSFLRGKIGEMGEERPSVYSQRAAYQVPGSSGTSLPQDSHSQLTAGNV